ncbi:MAG: hypothetical protein L0H53_16100 [Candidatus Nitrosocosmicus sp.]|nr:hypothetical protein [Candidatus Nitrosocosmicus sp.]MDN5868916.1 hypothetical protein [Candidatus Nitrosocosmicus sp.]
MSSPSSSIIYENIENFELGSYWEEHRETLDKLSKSNVPSKSSMFYIEVTADKNDETSHLLLKYGIINFSGNRKDFLRINAEMTADFLFKSEEIIYSNGGEQTKRTIISNENDISEGHKEWLKKLHKKHCRHQISEK